MKYRVNITNCISQIKNISTYSYRPLQRDETEIYIEVDTEAEAELIEDLNYTLYKATKIYMNIISLNIKN